MDSSHSLTTNREMVFFLRSVAAGSLESETKHNKQIRPCASTCLHIARILPRDPGANLFTYELQTKLLRKVTASKMAKAQA